MDIKIPEPIPLGFHFRSEVVEVAHRIELARRRGDDVPSYDDIVAYAIETVKSDLADDFWPSLRVVSVSYADAKRVVVNLAHEEVREALERMPLSNADLEKQRAESALYAEQRELSRDEVISVAKAKLDGLVSFGKDNYGEMRIETDSGDERVSVTLEYYN